MVYGIKCDMVYGIKSIWYKNKNKLNLNNLQL